MKSRSSLKKILNRDRKTLYVILGVVLVSIFSLSIVYAALSTTLNINGNAEVSSANWDIHLDNVQLNSQSVTTTAPTITSPTTATFSTTLSKPGDFYEFTIDVVNDGSIDAMIDGVTKTPTLSTTQAKYLNYIVEYQNGESMTTKQLVAKNSFVRLKVKVEFRKDITASDLPTTSETLNLAFTVNYVQSDDSDENVAIDNNGKLIKVVSGDLNTVGSEICIGEECFYIISSDTTSVTMLAKYNLHVGNECISVSSCTAYGDEATGIQDSTMLGSKGQNTRKGVVAFSLTNYWKSDTYPLYVYDSNSIVYEYVEEYKNYLEGLGIAVEASRLISVEELETLGCQKLSYCSSKYSWVYATSYWTGSAYDYIYVWPIYSDGDFRYAYVYSSDYSFGVRPVITIPKSEF